MKHKYKIGDLVKYTLLENREEIGTIDSIKWIGNLSYYCIDDYNIYEDDTFGKSFSIITKIETQGAYQEKFDEYLDKTFEKVEVAGKEYILSKALSRVDPTEYVILFDKWFESNIKINNNDKQYKRI